MAPSAWQVLAEHLGEECLKEEEETQEKWNNGGYSGYVEWMRDTIRIHRKHGLTKTVYYRVIESAELMPGAAKAVAEFQAYGAVTAIISGGFKPWRIACSAN